MDSSMNGFTGDTPRCVPLSRRTQIIEVLVFLFLIVPSMVMSLFVQQGNVSFPLVAISTIVRDLALICLILFLLWHNGEHDQRIGWTFQHGWSEIVLGLVLFFPLLFMAGLLEYVLRTLGFTSPATVPGYLQPRGAWQLLLGVVLVVVVALAEETIFRGYLILRLHAITRNLTAAVLLSATIFALGHGYEGSAGVITVGFIGLMYALIYVWRGSLVAPVTMHFLQDFLGIVLLPALGHR